MTEQDAVARLKELMTSGDNEAVHVEADAILINFLMSNGFRDIANAWTELDESVGFYYA